MNARDRAALAILCDLGGVIKLRHKSKAPVGKWRKLPGLTLAQAEQAIRDGFNLGFRTGNGIVVVDVDGPIPDWLAMTIRNTPTWITRTPRGGWHIWFKTNERLGNTAGKLAPGIDTRGEGGYVVIPPSRLDHNGYGWGNGHDGN